MTGVQTCALPILYPGGMNVVRLRAAFIPRRGNLGVSVAREPCPQEPSKGAQGRRLCPEEQGWQPPGLRRASWNRASFFPSAGGVTKQRHAWGLGRGADLWPSTLTPVLPPPPPPHRLPASFLRNPDGSKVCRAALNLPPTPPPPSPPSPPNPHHIHACPPPAPTHPHPLI